MVCRTRCGLLSDTASLPTDQLKSAKISACRCFACRGTVSAGTLRVVDWIGGMADWWREHRDALGRNGGRHSTLVERVLRHASHADEDSMLEMVM
jgi:hypothetical protein